jgi:tetratricopeptide (TPR) repeat protein
MRRLILFSSLLLILASIVSRAAVLLAVNSVDTAAAEQTSPLTPTPQVAGTRESGDTPSAPADGKTDYSKEPFVIEQLRARFLFEDDGTGRKEETIRVRVQSEAGVKKWGQLRFGYNSASEKLDIPYVRVIKPDGSAVTAGADAVQELSEPIQQTVYTDFHEKHVIVPGLRPGDVLECQTVTTIHAPMAPGQFWMQRDFQKSAIVMDEQLEVDIPAARTVKLKTKPGLDPKITESNGRRSYSWSASNLSREDDTKSGASQDQKKKKKRAGDELPAVQLTSFAGWEEVGRWYAGLEKDRRVPSAAVRAKADELTKGLQTDIEKIEALYDYTAKNFRYVSVSLGMGRYQPHSSEEVLHNQYGDCKDKNTLLASLLEAAGFHASSVLINFGRKLDPDIPSPAQFNHVITMVPLGKEEIWMDTTTEVAPFRLLSYPLRKKQSLVIAPDGVAHLEETPSDPPIPNSEILKINGKVDDAGTLDANIAYDIRGDSEIVMRQIFRNSASAQWQKIVEEMSSREGLGKDVSEVKVSDPSATRESFKLSYRVVRANYLDPSKKKLELKLPLPILGLAAADPDAADGPDPINLGAPKSRDYNVRLELPAKYTVRSLLPISLKRDYGNYEALYRLEGNTFTAERKLTVGQSELPSSRVQDYLAFRRSASGDLAQQLTLETTVAFKAEIPADAKPADLAKRGNDARKNGNYTLAIDLLKRAVDADAKNNMAWDDLGLAYLDSRQDEEAIKSFQKQIEINPYHPYAYNNLGRIYLRQRNYEEAIKWFNKQVEIDPLDKYAHANLGLAYLEQEKYAEAVPELEKAASLTPDNAEAQVRLGEVYLNVGQDEKAMTAFDNALKVSTKPVIWNNIAYQLARKKLNLDVARRYADSAVTSTAAALRTLSLDQLSPRDVGLTASLANFWDTLGWVDYADGNLSTAQKYIEAAWQLSQHSETGDHLGQIYEKEGQKEKALHQYALAMNARRPDAAVRTRLNTLAGGSDKADALINKSKAELLEERTVKVRNAVKQEGNADFFLLLTKGSGLGASVDSAKFISGDEKLKEFADTLRSIPYTVSLPDETSVRLLLRGTLSCTAATDCTFLLALPEDMKSID